MTTTCTHCNGTGHTPYLAFNIVSRQTIPVKEITWLILPETEDEAENRRQNYCRIDVEDCPYCYGEGWVKDNELETQWDIAEHRREERRDNR